LAVPTESKDVSPMPETGIPRDRGELIEIIRRRVREALIDRLDEFPPASLVRLWQLIEDPKLLLPIESAEKDPFEVSAETKEKIFALLDAELKEN
ncbi:MAG: hypothetical protein KC940_15865, partial [Candidatus Omnitrophica bacterium]|nr:hypothetical protein [Candidatus Omnitrophota bacterium]